MKTVRVVMFSLLIVLLCARFSPAQENVATAANAAVPPLIPFASVATDEGGSSLSGVVNITFSLYAGQQGGVPLWTETQNNVQLDSTGHYSVQLGITKPNGVPTTLFTSDEARWLGVRIAEQGEQPRVLLLSVPYALKAGDAATVGGLPPSAFVLAAPALNATMAAPLDANAPPPASGPVTGAGTVNYLPLWDSISNIISSVISQSGTGTTAKIGIGTATPATMLDIKGSSTVRGNLGLPATGTATATAGKNSQPLSFTASAYNSSTAAAVNQVFRWQAEPASNKTATPSGTLNLLFGEGTATPAETGLHIASDGLITFAAGQTFPGGGGGSGTVTSVATGLGLMGGPIITSGTLTIDTTVVPRLAAANTFAANQTVNGTFAANSGGNAIVGTSSGTTSFGLWGQSQFVGIYGQSFDLSGGEGVEGVITSPTGYGVAGLNEAQTGNSVGVRGSSSSTTGYGVEGDSPSIGVYGTGETGVQGSTTITGGIGVYGQAEFASVVGETSGGYAGLWGDTGGAQGEYAAVLGTADENYAGDFYNSSNLRGTIHAKNSTTASGGVVFLGEIPYVENNALAVAIIGDPGCGAGDNRMAIQLSQDGMTNCTNYTLTAGNNGETYVNANASETVHLRVNNVDALVASNSGVNVVGTLTKTTGSFKIDHPLDPANKYLYHSFVESPDMMNIYSGVIVLDANGEAVVGLPDWFEALNRDFRYQLTPVGAPGPNLYIAEEVASNQFKIAGGKPGSKVSWQVTGIRQDVYANAHRIQVEVDKAPTDRGHYLFPELYGAPETARIGYDAPRPAGKLVAQHLPAHPRRSNISPLPRMPLSLPVRRRPICRSRFCRA